MRFLIVSLSFTLALVLAGCSASVVSPDRPARSVSPTAPAAVATAAQPAGIPTGQADVAVKTPVEGTRSARAGVVEAFKRWVGAMTVGDVPAAVSRFGTANLARDWIEGDMENHCSSYRIDSVQVEGERATVRATFHVEEIVWSTGAHRVVSEDEPYVAVLRRGAGGWKVDSADDNLFRVDR